MTDYLDIKEAAKQLGMTERHIRRLCTFGQLTGAVKDGNGWRIPVTADARLAGACIVDDLARSDQLIDVPAKKRTEALRRLGIIRECESYCGHAARNGTNRTTALKAFAAKKGIPKRTVERWIAMFRDEGLIGLVDYRGRSKFVSERLSPQAFEFFKSMYLNESRLTAKTCWQNTKYVNSSESRKWNIPSLSYMYRYINETIPYPVGVLHREGLAAYEAKCAPFVQVDPESVQPGQVWVGDHHQLNCWVRYRNKWVRPWLTAWQDMRSRSIVGRHISACPNQTTVLLAMRRGIEKHGPPDSVKIDNGRDYDSEMWTGTTKARRRAVNKGYLDEQMVAGIYAMMEIGVSFAIPYHPQSKSIERFFDTLDVQFTKTMPTYCGKDTNRKPEHLTDLLKSEKAVSNAYSLEEFTELIDKYIDVYNNASHTGFGMEGQTPNHVLAGRTSERVLADGVLDLLMRVWSKELKVGKNGVLFSRIWYGQYDATLQMYQGRKVRIAYDPDDLRRVYVYDAATMTLLTIAEQNQLVNYGRAVDEESLREAMRQKGRAVKIARQFKDSRLAANTDLPTLTLKAMQEAARETRQDDKPTRVATLRPVATPLNNQIQRHRRLEIIKEVRKAAGAETVCKVLNIDLASLVPKTTEDIRLFDER